MRSAFFIFIYLSVANSFAADIDKQRAHFNYMMSCQGCHTPGGDSPQGNVPRMKNTVGYFLSTQKGREYLVRVPGSATSTLSDEHLAEVLNWIISEFSGDSKPEQFLPYTTGEVADLRKDPLTELVEYRKQLLEEINELHDVPIYKQTNNSE